MFEMQSGEVKMVRKRKNKSKNAGSFTVEISVIMVLYLLIILAFFQAFFVLLKNVNQYCARIDQRASIEKEVESIRRWQYVGGAL